jgi:TolB-like protein/predicted Zn-dependent protease
VAEGGGEGHTGGVHTGTPDVFISYASQDAVLATTVVEALERSGVACWIAPRDVTPGAFYADEIVHAIDAAKAIVLILSVNAADSQHVLREVERAASKRHPVVSLRIDQAPLPAGLEYFLNTSQWLNASGGDVARSMPKLIAAVQVAVQAPVVTPEKTPTPRGPAPSTSAGSSKRTAIIVTSMIGLAIAGFAIDRLWVSSRRAAATSVPTAAVPAPAPAPAAPAIPEKSVAVLPFVDMSEKKDQEYFSDGLSEELIDKLSKVPDLRVPARTSSFYFKGKQTSMAEIAKALGVSHVLEGSVRKFGNKLRITVQLIRCDNGYHVWSESYDRQFSDIFKIQDDVANAVVLALKASILSGTTSRTTAPTDSDAYNLLLQARSIWKHGQRKDELMAIDYLHEALKKDPKFSVAWATLAMYLVRHFTVYTDGSFRTIRNQAVAAAEKALDLDPYLPEARLAMAAIRFDLDWDWVAARREIELALQRDPGSVPAIIYASSIAYIQGRKEESLQLMRRAAELDPLNARVLKDLAYVYGDADQTMEQEQALRKAIELNPTGDGIHYLLALSLLRQGKPEAALEELKQEPEETYRMTGQVLALDAIGRRDEADRIIAVAERKYGDSGFAGFVMIYASRNDLDKAFYWLDRGYAMHDGGLPYLASDYYGRNLRSDPRFKAFLRKMNLPE